MPPTDTKRQYQKLYNEKSTRLRELMELQRANFNTTDPVIVHELRTIDTEMIKLRASIDALETVEDLSETLPPVEDRRAQANNEHRNHIMVATVQAMVAEFSNLRKHVDEGFTDLRRLMARTWLLALGVAVALVVVVLLLQAGVL